MRGIWSLGGVQMAVGGLIDATCGAASMLILALMLWSAAAGALRLLFGAVLQGDRRWLA